MALPAMTFGHRMLHEMIGRDDLNAGRVGHNAADAAEMIDVRVRVDDSDDGFVAERAAREGKTGGGSFGA